MKKRRTEPFMAADAYGRSLKGAGVNLLVSDIARSVTFAREVLGLEVLYDDADFAVLLHADHHILLHADHTYGDHPLLALTGDGAVRGAGAELRLYDLDPDAAEARARDHPLASLVAKTRDKPHGLRECFIAGPDGYVWVPGVAIGGD